MKPGDLVRLKSGGPVMTVGANTPDGWLCFWYGESEVRQATVRQGALDPIYSSETKAGMRTEYGDLIDKVSSWPKNVRREMIRFLERYEREAP